MHSIKWLIDLQVCEFDCEVGNRRIGQGDVPTKSQLDDKERSIKLEAINKRAVWNGEGTKPPFSLILPLSYLH